MANNCTQVPYCKPSIVSPMYPSINIISKDGSIIIKKDGPIVWDLKVNPTLISSITNIYTSDSQTIDFSGSGTQSSPLTAIVKVSSVANNVLSLQSDGLYVSSTSSGVDTISGTINRITSTGGDNPIIDISPNYAGQSSISILGIITTGFWNADPIAPAYGGVPTGGNIGQVLVKNTTNDYDTSWQNPSASSITGGKEEFTPIDGQVTFTTLGTLPSEEFKITVTRNGSEVDFTYTLNSFTITGLDSGDSISSSDKIRIKWFD